MTFRRYLTSGTALSSPPLPDASVERSSARQIILMGFQNHEKRNTTTNVATNAMPNINSSAIFAPLVSPRFSRLTQLRRQVRDTFPLIHPQLAFNSCARYVDRTAVGEWTPPDPRIAFATNLRNRPRTTGRVHGQLGGAHRRQCRMIATGYPSVNA